MENKINSFDAKFNDLVEALHANQRALLAEREVHQHHIEPENYPSYPHTRFSTPATPDFRKLHSPYLEEDQPYKRRRFVQDDFRNGFLTLEEARLLFKFFEENISQQLFGFEINKFSVDAIWETSPILICAICTIASMHYPDATISSKLKALQQYLNNLCAGLLFQGKPRTEREGFNTIVALVLCSFWLSDSQRFTGLALQLAKEFELNKPVPTNATKDSLPEKDRLKLWYLLYILDGQQSMTFNRQALFDAGDYSLKHSRELLLTDSSKKTIEGTPDQKEKEEFKPQTLLRTSSVRRTNYFTDLGLVSQVEYNQALAVAFKGNAWDLIAPTSFGIPSKSNLELDKWMVSWTVLLAPVMNGAVWLSKSTLIYYNFAKMHINCSVVRQLQIDTGDESVVFPKWENLNSVLDKQRDQKLSVAPEEDPETDSDDEQEFISNNELTTQDESILSLGIAVNAAQTVLNLVLNDTDILNNLKYVPVHIHIMLYYAALILVNPPSMLGATIEPKLLSYYQKIVSNLKTVKALQRKIYLNLPTDRNFGVRLIKSLDDVLEERIRKLRIEMKEGDLDAPTTAKLLSEAYALQEINNKVELVLDSNENSSGDSSPKPERISAWPGSHHGHP